MMHRTNVRDEIEVACMCCVQASRWEFCFASGDFVIGNLQYSPVDRQYRGFIRQVSSG
jgi:hypothetical protein